MTALVELRQVNIGVAPWDRLPWMEEGLPLWGWDEHAEEEPALRPEAGDLDRWLDLNA